MGSGSSINSKKCTVLPKILVSQAGTPEISAQSLFMTLLRFCMKKTLHQLWLEPSSWLPEDDHGHVGPYWASVPLPVYCGCKAGPHHHQCVGDMSSLRHGHLTPVRESEPWAHCGWHSVQIKKSEPWQLRGAFREGRYTRPFYQVFARWLLKQQHKFFFQVKSKTVEGHVILK